MDRKCSFPQDIIISSSTNSKNLNTSRRNSFRNKIRSYCSTCVNLCDADDVTDIVSTSWSRFLKPGLFILTFVAIVIILAVFLYPKSDKVLISFCKKDNVPVKLFIWEKFPFKHFCLTRYAFSGLAVFPLLVHGQKEVPSSTFFHSPPLS